MPGINVVSAADLAAELGPIAHYANARCILGRAGLRPSRYQSDQVDLCNGPLPHACNRRLVLQIELDDFPAAARHRFQILLGADTIERHDFRAHVGQHHAGERSRADAGEFDDAEAGERAGGAGSGLGGWFVEHLFSLPRERL